MQLDDAVQRVRRLLYELNARLTFFAGDVRVSYVIEGFGELRGLRQGEYRLELPRDPGGSPLALSCECRGEGPDLVRQVEGTPATVEHHWQYLERHGLRFKTERVYADAAAPRLSGPATHVAFHVARFVPVSLWFDVDRPAGLMRLSVKNLERLGRVSYPLRPEMVTAELFDELFRAITRQSNRLNEVTGFHVPRDIRERLRQRLEEDARRKARELAGGRAGGRPGGFLARLIRRGEGRE